MRKFLSHAFVLLVNYYFLAFLVGIVLVAISIANGPVPLLTVGIAVFASFLVVLGYQLTRSRRYQSIGEQIVGSTSKVTIVEQRNDFGVTRSLLLFLVLMTLMLNGNTQDGLSRQAAYSVADLGVFAVIWVVQYQGFRSFPENPGMVPIITIAALLFALGLAIQGGYHKLVSRDVATLAGDNIIRLYKGFGLVWLLVGFYYRSHYQRQAEQGTPSR